LGFAAGAGFDAAGCGDAAGACFAGAEATTLLGAGADAD
jgi:hypothetical protein